MDCVKCDGVLSEVEVGGVSVDRCGDCQGIWFDSSEVRQLIAALSRGDGSGVNSEASPASKKLDEKQGNCPHCGQQLAPIESMAVDGLTYDQCMACRGAWLDGGEIHLVVDAGEMVSFFNEMD